LRDQASPRCTVCQKLAEALIESVGTAYTAKAAFAVVLRRPGGDTVAAAATLKAARDAQLEAEIAVRAHIAKHACRVDDGHLSQY